MVSAETVDETRHERLGKPLVSFVDKISAIRRPFLPTTVEESKLIFGYSKRSCASEESNLDLHGHNVMF